MFLRNVWYPAAWEREIGEGPYAATILGEQVAIYRRTDGSYAALHDACPHRKLPLSDVISECAVHPTKKNLSGSKTTRGLT